MRLVYHFVIETLLATSRNRKTESDAPLPARPCPSYATIFHAATLYRIASESMWNGLVVSSVPWSFAMNIEPRYLHFSTPSNGSSSSRTAWHSPPVKSPDITLIFGAEMTGHLMTYNMVQQTAVLSAHFCRSDSYDLHPRPVSWFNTKGAVWREDTPALLNRAGMA